MASTSREREDQAVEDVGREGGGDGDGRGGGGISAADVVNYADESEIREMVWRYGDEKRVRRFFFSLLYCTHVHTNASTHRHLQRRLALEMM